MDTVSYTHLDVYKRQMLYLPFCVSLSVSTVIWQMLLNVNNGVVNSILGIFGVKPIGFLIDKNWALLSIILISSWRGCAYWMMFFLAGLKGIDLSVYESAKMDGSGFFSTLFRITTVSYTHLILPTTTIFLERSVGGRSMLSSCENAQEGVNKRDAEASSFFSHFWIRASQM